MVVGQGSSQSFSSRDMLGPDDELISLIIIQAGTFLLMPYGTSIASTTFGLVRHDVHSISDELTTLVEADGVAACSSFRNNDSEDVPLGPDGFGVNV